MGTSSDYGGGTGGNWTSYKHAAANFAKRGGGGHRTERVLARYVGALGGASAAAGGGGARRAAAATQGVGGFGAGLATQGLTPTLADLGLGHLIGGDRFEVLDGLLDALGGDGASLEDQAVLAALCDAFENLYPEDAETYEDLESVTLDRDGVVGFIEEFVAAWAYHQMLPTLAEKFTHIEDSAEAARRDSLLRERLGLLVKLELEDRDPLVVDWRGDEGRDIAERVIADLYEHMEDLEQ